MQGGPGVPTPSCVLPLCVHKAVHRVGTIISHETCLVRTGTLLYFRIPPPVPLVGALLACGVQAPPSTGQAGQHFPVESHCLGGRGGGSSASSSSHRVAMGEGSSPSPCAWPWPSPTAPTLQLTAQGPGMVFTHQSLSFHIWQMGTVDTPGLL